MTTLLTRIAELEDKANTVQKDLGYVATHSAWQEYLETNPTTILELCSALRKAVEALELVVEVHRKAAMVAVQSDAQELRRIAYESAREFLREIECPV